MSPLAGDPGLQPERTELARVRTALAAAGAAAATAVCWARLGVPAVALAALLVGTVGLVPLARSARRDGVVGSRDVVPLTVTALVAVVLGVLGAAAGLVGASG